MLAVAGGKGGCGKTTTAVGLAAALARADERPLVVDCDCDMPALHHVTGTAREHGIDALAAGASPREVSQQAAQAGVRVITAGRRGNVGAALTRLAAWPGPVLLDTPAGATPDATRPLRHADRTLLVTTTTPQCLDDTARTATTARELGAIIDGVVVRHRDDPADLTRFVCNDLELPVLANVPTVDGDPLLDARTRDAFDSAAAGLSSTLAPSR
ncbi:MAG: AAA family ATPase [Halovenus sp.]